MKTNDWSRIRKPEDKKNLISIVKDLGYDGYFNWEIEKEMIDKLKESEEIMERVPYLYKVWPDIPTVW